MLFFKKRTNRSPVRIAILSSAAFIGAAVWAWDVPFETVGHYFLMALLLTVGLMLLAGVTVLILKGMQKLLRKP